MALDHEGTVHTGTPGGLKKVASGHPAFDTYDGLPKRAMPVSASDTLSGNEKLAREYDERMQRIIDSEEISAETLIAEAHKRN